ncbi:acetyltransferase family protein [Acinetobacter baumannii 348935]|nr:acetyltransferase family protein [Acinetobacter baumannii 348935]
MQRHPHRNQTQTRQTLENWAGQKWEDSDPEFMWIIADHLTQQPMGILIFIQRHDIGEVHFGLGTPYQGQGLMCEAMTSVIQFLKQSQKLTKIETFCATEHLASRQVLEKTGFRQVQLLTAYAKFPLLGDKAQDCIQYCIIFNS